MLKVSLWGNEADVQTEMAHWCLDVIDGKYRVFSTTTIEDNTIISTKLLEVISLLEKIEIILKDFPEGLKCKAYFLFNTPQCKVIKLNLKNKAFLVGDSTHYSLTALLQAHNDITRLGKDKFYLMNNLFEYLKIFLPNKSSKAYLVIQGDIYDIPKYLLNKQLFSASNNTKPLTSIKSTSNIQPTGNSNTLNSLFS